MKHARECKDFLCSAMSKKTLIKKFWKSCYCSGDEVDGATFVKKKRSQKFPFPRLQPTANSRVQHLQWIILIKMT